MDELKPCPFCGGKAMLFSQKHGLPRHSVNCPNCHIGTIAFTEAEKAITAWNRRAAE